MFTLIRTFAIATLAATSFSCGHVDEVTPKKYVTLVVAHAAPLKIEIAKFLRANPGQPVPQSGALRLPPPAGVAAMEVDFGWVTASGAIIIHNHRHDVVLVQEPSAASNEIRWSCVVHPGTAKPDLCGSDYENSLLKIK